MGHPTPTLDRSRLVKALVAMLDRAMPACAQIEYRLVGTGAALLHGVQLPAADIDILVKERSAVDAFGAALVGFKCLDAPALLHGGRQYYGNYEVDGVEVGFSTVEVEMDADTSECTGPGPWKHFVLLPCGPYMVPTVTLEMRLITELYRQRPERYEPLIEFMQAHGCDVDLVRRGMATFGLAQAVQDDVLHRLAKA